MSDKAGLSDPDSVDALAQSVSRVLSDLYEDANRAMPEDRHEFAFNVLLKLLFSVLEAVRSDTPEEFGKYLQLMLRALQDDRSHAPECGENPSRQRKVEF